MAELPGQAVTALEDTAVDVNAPATPASDFTYATVPPPKASAVTRPTPELRTESLTILLAYI
ncbi:hypothetical protein [Streptomyces sp. NPDC052693]|uniref:hypothetical protein n=1 Tax=Streptomyces sp. NPDC052693 TaxID=3155814 RepID=UPI0034391314